MDLKDLREVNDTTYDDSHTLTFKWNKFGNRMKFAQAGALRKTGKFSWQSR